MLSIKYKHTRRDKILAHHYKLKSENNDSIKNKIKNRIKSKIKNRRI